MQFYKLLWLWLWFYVDFSLNLGFYCNDVEYRHKTFGFRVLVQPAKPALPIRLLYEELPNVYVYSAHKMFTTFFLLFLIEYLISRFWLCLSLCALFIVNTNPRKPCVSRSLKIGIAFLIFSYSKAKKAKMFFV